MTVRPLHLSIHDAPFRRPRAAAHGPSQEYYLVLHVLAHVIDQEGQVLVRDTGAQQFSFNASNLFTRMEMMTGYAGSKGVPAPKLAVIVTGLLLLGGLSILAGFQPVVGVVLLAIFFLPVTFKMHNFWAQPDQ